ncbi:MAG: 4-(cytidine 5'-diphospho)-2-C-methyl-D-erythritol kinase [Eubacterium sp.]|nr:4-(cytidine 5'-diphospho)-2-C-methyl-D-erythritol kinase [Eubacterium sp.]
MAGEKQIWMKANAKINLGLDVLRRRKDGYHDVCMVMQSLDLSDDVFLEKRSDDEIRLKTNLASLPDDESNLAYKAAKLMKEKYRIKQGVAVSIQKRIPIAAGMAGGSADAAAVLRGMNELFDLGLSMEELQKTGVKLGADVPYCVMGGCALAEGIGEKLTKLDGPSGYPILLAKPDIEVSTKHVYESLSLEDKSSHPDVKQLLQDVENQEVSAMARHIGNILETVTIAEYPVIDQIKKQMKVSGAVNSLMSGSGPTVFGIFEDGTVLQNAYSDMVKTGLAKDVIMTYAV